MSTINSPEVTSRVEEGIFENKPVGYDRIYSNKDGDILEYSYFPNLLDPRMGNLYPVPDTLNEDNILEKADRLIKKLKNLDTKHNNF